MKWARLGAIFGALLAVATPARAAITENDLLVAARALSFMENPPTGNVRIGIVYRPDAAQSAEEARHLQQMLADGLRVGDLVLRPMMVPVADATRADVGLFFLTGGVGAAGASVAAASRSKHVPCITTDIAQVRSGACAIGVRAAPRVEILVNRAAAADSGVSFSTAFRMLITEF